MVIIVDMPRIKYIGIVTWNYIYACVYIIEIYHIYISYIYIIYIKFVSDIDAKL